MIDKDILLRKLMAEREKLVKQADHLKQAIEAIDYALNVISNVTNKETSHATRNKKRRREGY